MQHFLNAISRTTVPAVQQCLLELTKWMNVLLSGHAHPSLSPWIGEAPLTALRKGENSACPIAVGDVYRHLASHLCCAAVRTELPELFLPYSQVGVGSKRGLEVATHALRLYIEEHGQEQDLCLLKIDIQYAKSSSSFLTSLGVYNVVTIHK